MRQLREQFVAGRRIKAFINTLLLLGQLLITRSPFIVDSVTDRETCYPIQIPEGDAHFSARQMKGVGDRTPMVQEPLVNARFSMEIARCRLNGPKETYLLQGLFMLNDYPIGPSFITGVRA